jgi:Bacterial Ig domain/Right handed beta helix region
MADSFSMGRRYERPRRNGLSALVAGGLVCAIVAGALVATAGTSGRRRVLRGSLCTTSPSKCDTSRPSIRITRPLAGATISGSVKVRGRAADNRRVKRVVVRIEGDLLRTRALGTRRWGVTLVTSRLTDGLHVIQATAFDAAGNSSRKRIKVKVQNGSAPDPSSTPSPSPAPSVAPPSTSPSVGGPTFYVATNGNDGNDGSSSNPWATIRWALQRAQPGDTIVVEAGSYAPASFVRGGLSGAPITLRADGLVTLTGNGSGAGFLVSGVSYVVVDGFDITNFQFGIELDDVTDVIVRGNTLRSNQSVGVQTVRSSRVDVVQNKLLDPAPPYPGPAVQDYGVNFYQSDHVTANNNYFYGDHNQALSFKRIDTDSEAIGNTFEGCMYVCIYVGQNDDDQYGDQTSVRITVENNRAKAVAGYRCSQPYAVRNVNNAVVENNIIDPSCLDDLVTVVSSPQLSGVGAGNNTVLNNIVQAW